MELEKSEQDLVIISHLQSCRTLQSSDNNEGIENSTPVSNNEE